MNNYSKINQFTYADIAGAALEFYNRMMANAPKPSGNKMISPSPVMIGHNLNGDILRMKIGQHKFDKTTNKHFFLELEYGEKMTEDELKLLSNHKTEPAVNFLVAFSKKGWAEMDKAYAKYIENTVFAKSKFVDFDEWGINQQIRNLQSLR